MAARLSSFSCIGFNSFLPFFMPKQGNSNPLKILSFSIHSSNQCYSKSNYVFEDVNCLAEAVTLFSQMLQMKPMPPICDFNKLFSIIVRLNHGSQVGFLLKRLSLFGLDSSIKECKVGRNGKYWFGFEGIRNIDDAVGLFDQMLQLRPVASVYDYGQLLNVVVKMKEYSEVIFMFKKLSFLGYPIDDVIMTTVVNCYCNLKEVDSGFAILAGMIKHGYAPDIVSITCLIKGLFIEENVFKAVELFKKVARDGFCEVNEITIATVLDGLVKSGNLVNAVMLLEMLERRNVELNVVAYTTILDGLCKGGMVEDAMNLLFKMIDRGVVPNGVTFTSFIHGLCNHNRLDFARYIFNDLASKKIRPDKIAYSVMIQGLCQRGLFRDVKEMLEKMELVGRFPDGVTYNIILQGCLKHCDNIHSVDLFKIIIERDFQLDARSHFMLLHQIRGSCGGGVRISNLIQKFIFSDTIRHQTQGSNNDVMINTLMQKLISSFAIYARE